MNRWSDEPMDRFLLINPDLDSLYGPGFTLLLGHVDHRPGQANILLGRFEGARRLGEEFLDDPLPREADDALVGARHAGVGEIGGPARANGLVGGWDVGVRPDDSRYASVQVPAQGDLLRGGFRVH